MDELISREAVDKLSRDLVHVTRDKADFLCNFWEGLNALPSVTPERPKGKWIFCYGNRGKDNVEKCSCCKSYWKEAVIYRYDTQEYLRLRLKYCPKCGAEMEEEK